MRSSVLILTLLLSGLTAFYHPACGQAEHDHAGFYVVADYDEARSPSEDLEAAVERARAEGKRILIQVGGEWCGWCFGIMV